MSERHYEIMFVCDVEEYKQTQEEIRQLILQHGAHIHKEEELGLRELAYPIQKHKKGFYFVLYVHCTVEHMQAFEKDLRLKEKVLRHMSFTIKTKQYIRRGKKKVRVVDNQVQIKQRRKPQDSTIQAEATEGHTTQEEPPRTDQSL